MSDITNVAGTLPISFLSIFKMIDAYIVDENLRYNAEQDELAALAQALEAKLWRMQQCMDVDIPAIVRGEKQSMVSAPRYHDHKKVQTLEGLDSAEAIKTVSGCIAALIQTHVRYFNTQSQIQVIKKKMTEGTRPGDPPMEKLNADLVQLQFIIDACNQARNDYIARGDQLFMDLIEEIRSSK